MNQPLVQDIGMIVYEQLDPLQTPLCSLWLLDTRHRILLPQLPQPESAMTATLGAFSKVEKGRVILLIGFDVLQQPLGQGLECLQGLWILEQL